MSEGHVDKKVTAGQHPKGTPTNEVSRERVISARTNYRQRTLSVEC